MAADTDVLNLAKRRGFFWKSSEIYGGFSGFYDYGIIGTRLKRKLEDSWRRYFLSLSPHFFEIETTTIMPEAVFKASGHIDNFVDPVAKCAKCGTYHRADHIMEDVLHESFEGMSEEKLSALIKKHKIRCPHCKGELGQVSLLNMMFPVSIGADKAVRGFLRPETAQGPYVNFLENFQVARKQLPLGLALIGKAYRNEISPRQGTARMREFTQAELQIFFNPERLDSHEEWNSVQNTSLHLLYVGKKQIKKTKAKDAKIPKFYVYHMVKVQEFFLSVLGIPEKKFRFRELSDEERAFYNKIHWDIEIDIDVLGGFKECGGIHYRGDHDLSGHENISGKSHSVFVDEKKYIPHVLELSFGVDRLLLALLDVSFKQSKERTVLAFPSSIAPFSAAIFPLVKKDNIPKKAKEVYTLLSSHFDVLYDQVGSIGKRYYRQDEIGTPFAITVDYDSLKDNTVTIRDRDNQKQVRLPIKGIVDSLDTLLHGTPLEKVGKTSKKA